MHNKTVLICDDSRSIRTITRRALSRHGYEVISEACDGREAVDKYLEHKPKFTLLDLVMPDTDGKQALREIIKSDPTAKIVILSSLGSENDVEECLKNGASSYIQKPFEEDVLLRVLESIK